LLALHVAELGSDARAILDLSLRYGFSDERLAAMLQLGLEDVAVRRELALSELSVRAGVEELDRPRLEEALREVPHETWIGRELRDPAPEPDRPIAGGEAQPPPPPEAPVAAATSEPSESRHSLRWIGGLLALAAAAVVIALAASGDDDAESQGAATQAQAPGAPAGDNSGERARAQGQDRSQGNAQPGGRGDQRITMKPILGAAPSTATIRLVSPGPPPQLALRFETKADHAGIYEVWLYDTVIDAQPLAKIPHNGGIARFELPDSADEYRYLDISEEKPGGFAGHSGRSVERIGLPVAVAGLGIR
jgi:hypothetical protein